MRREAIQLFWREWKWEREEGRGSDILCAPYWIVIDREWYVLV